MLVFFKYSDADECFQERKEQKLTLRPLAVTNFLSKSMKDDRERRRKYIVI